MKFIKNAETNQMADKENQVRQLQYVTVKY